VHPFAAVGAPGSLRGVEPTPGEELQPATRRVVEAAAARGVEVAVRRFPEGTRTAADAARAIGCDVGAIAKSIVLTSDDGPILVLTSGANRVDYDAVARLAGVTGVRRADADEARAATGYAIGGTAPFGHPSPLTVLADADLLAFDVVWAAAGTPDTVFPVAPALLVEAAGAVVGEVAERRSMEAR
jgi:prolyl-tRNA editing enzyme YbaK/EbsC (Cys-tRNA(Pro) deacylase)